MSAVLVDSNVLLDILGKETVWTPWSSHALQDAANDSRLVINAVIYAEISVGYDDIETADAALPAQVTRENIPYEAAFLAGKAYRRYRRQGGARQSPLPDFFIGAHAAVQGYALLTRDAQRYRFYFPKVRLIVPEEP
jgi:predicted nucleic acid-binding protein